MKPILECVPNFSEGRRPKIIEQIASAIRAIEGVQLLHMDTGYAANRTVMTFVGEPKYVLEAAFASIKKAAELIDMRRQTGVHPRKGATEVSPLIPEKELRWEETQA